MNLARTVSIADFVAGRPYDALQDRFKRVFDALLARFKPLPQEFEGVDPSVLTEMGSFLINQGVAVEILENSYDDENADDDTYIYVIDIAYVPDCYNLAAVGDGSKHKLRIQLVADSFEDAVKGIADIMLATS